MQSRYAIVLLIILPFLSGNGNGFRFKVAFKANKVYRTSIVTISDGTVNYKASKEILNELKSRGATFPIVTRKKQTIVMVSRTGTIDSRGVIPFSDRVDSASVIQFVNGELQAEKPRMPIDTSFKMTGFIRNDSMIVEDIEGRNMNPMIKKSVKSMVTQMIKSVKFPDRSLEPGDSFVQTVPLTIPLGQLGEIGMTITTRYKLRQITSGLADFDIDQKYDMASNSDSLKFTASGAGKGKMEFDTREDYITLMDTRSSMTMVAHVGPLDMVVESKDRSDISTTITGR